MMKTILASILATAFLISVPVRAEDKAAAPAGEKGAKKDDKAKKDKKDSKEGAKKEEKAGGGW